MIPIGTLVSKYGYAAIVIGTFFEGETVLASGGFAMHRGYLALTKVIFCGFLGTLCGDQLYFYIGRSKGVRFLEKRPYWRARSERVLGLLYKYQSLLILGFRFLYCLRTVTPFLLGAGGISYIRFLVLNILGALLWAASIGVLGYLFGNVFELFIGDIERHESYLFIGLAAIGTVVWCVHWLRRQKAAKRLAESKK
ncbi:MAG: DedA family protein [Syntrophobacteraceae bacterium]